MSEFNFDKMRNLNIPDEWAEKTIKKANNIKIVKVSEHFRYTKVALIASLLFFLIATVFTFALEDSNVGIVGTQETQSNNAKNPSNSSVYAVETEETDEETEISSYNTAQTDSVEDDKIKTDNNMITDLTEPVESENETVFQPDTPQYGGEPSTENTENEKENFSVKAIIDNNKLADSSEIYCRMYNSGVLVGSSDLFSQQHKAEIVEKNDTSTVVRYYPYRNNAVVNGGDPLYILTFYNEYGVDVYTCAVSLKN